MFGIDDVAIAAAIAASTATAANQTKQALTKPKEPPPAQPHYGGGVRGASSGRTGREIVAQTMMKIAMAPRKDTGLGASSPSVMGQQQSQIPVAEPQQAAPPALGAGMAQMAAPRQPIPMQPMQRQGGFTGGNPLNALMMGRR